MTVMTSGIATTGDTPLLERERELAVFDELLGGNRVGSCLVLIEGPAGIGKSRLVDELVGRARQNGVRVLAAHGAHLERDFPYGVVRQLFEPALAEDRGMRPRRGLCAPQRRRRAPPARAARRSA